jgi:hypothetical protein
MLLDESNITIVYNQRLNRAKGVKKKKNLITSIAMETGEVYTAKSLH